MKVESIAEFCNSFELHLGILSLENQILVFFEWPLKTGFTIILRYGLYSLYLVQSAKLCICIKRNIEQEHKPKIAVHYLYLNA